MRTRAAFLVCLLAVLGTGVACSDDDSSSKNTTTTTTQGFEVNTPDGQASLSLSGQLPPNWPTDFPVPEGAEPAGSGSLGGTSSTNFIGVYSTSESPQDAYDFYKNNSELTQTGSSSIGSIGTVSFTGTWSGFVVTTPYNNETLIVISLSTSTDTTVAGSTNDTASSS